MILGELSKRLAFLSDLHVCGDDPATILRQSGYGPVISTYVEMIHGGDYSKIGGKSDLHVCGDDPFLALGSLLDKM